MPLKKSASKEAFTKNLHAELGVGKPLKQAIAIALAVQRKSAGKAPYKPSKRK